MNEEPIGLFKIFIIGKKGVGKSTLAKLLGFVTFDESIRPTIGVEIFPYNHSIKSSINNQFIRFHIWIYGPKYEFRNFLLLKNYLVGSKVIFIMFDVSDLTSLNEIDNWMEVIRERSKLEFDVPIMLLGNKADLTGHLGPAKVLADALVKKFGLMGYYEISALKSWNIELTFTTMAETLLKKYWPNLVKKL